MRETPLNALFAALLVTGCAGGSTPPSDTGTAVAETGPCAQGGWGAIEAPAMSIHVRIDGDDQTGDGTDAAPFATPAVGLAASRAAGAAPLALGPGAFDAAMVLSDDSGEGASDDGLVIQGCGVDQTSLIGGSDTSILSAVGVQELALAGLRFDGGRRALWLRGGTTALLVDVEIHDSRRLGLVVEGSSTLVEMDRVSVYDTVPETLGSGASMGYGITVDGGTLTMVEGGSYGSTGVGILGALATVRLVDVTVSGTLAGADGTLGRGVQLQDLSLGEIDGGLFADNQDAGLFATRTLDLQVKALAVERTAAGAVPGSQVTTGDGIVVTQGAQGDNDPADFTASLVGCVIDGTDRAAVVLDGVTAEVSDHTHLNNGLVVEGSSTFTQGGAIATGNVGAAEVDAEVPLGLNHQLVARDSFED